MWSWRWHGDPLSRTDRQAEIDARRCHRSFTLDGGTEHTRSRSKFRSIPPALPRHFVSTHNTRGTILLRWAAPQSRTVIWRGLGSQRYYTTVVWDIAQGTLGERDGA